MATGKKEIRVHNSISSTAKNPIAIDFGSRAFTYLGNHLYLPFFAPDDNLFRTLLETRLLSTTHSSCIGDKTFYSIGKGLKMIDDSDIPEELQGKINARR